VRDEARLEGQVAVVTGGGRGIGRAAAILLAQAGAAVVVTARTATEVEETAEHIRRQGGRAQALPADVSDWAAMERLAEETTQAFGPADIVVANAGVIHPVGDTWEVEPADWAQNLTINLTGSFYTARAFLPAMVARRSGVLIFVSSGAASHPVPGWSAYCAAKAGAEHFVRNVAAEVDQRGLPIRVHALYPGIVATAMQEKPRLGRTVSPGRPVSQLPRTKAAPPAARASDAHLVAGHAASRRFPRPGGEHRRCSHP